MRLKNADGLLLKNIWAFLETSGRHDLSAGLRELLDRYEKDKAEVQAANRRRALENRKAGYTWPSVPVPKTSKYYGKEAGTHE